MGWLVGDDEKEDFFGSLKRRKYAAEDFELVEKPDPTQGGTSSAEPITGTVTIRNKRSGVERTYKAGHGSTWPAQFDGDLASGRFDAR